MAVTRAAAVVVVLAPGARRADPFVPPRPYVPPDRVLYRTALAACLLFVAGILAGVEIGIASGSGRRDPGRGLRGAGPAPAGLALVPWRLLVFVTGLFLVGRPSAGTGWTR
ncbi:hypothetical protein V2I01_36230 [Micromonospora sp. BRA006-A]|nr:hypothetical protein [Micromonospora sp. BRA006-A]